MRRIISISSLVTAVFVMLAFLFVPHHHHHDFMCWKMVVCEQDGAVNDEHTGHDASDTHTDSTHTGEINDMETPPENDVLSFADPFSDDVSIICYIPDFLCNPAVNSTTENKYATDKTFYESADVGSPHGLRAPPLTL
ncbi:MAG: hypothetical protein LBR49_08470 [Tannerella sp.]|nr:hypothetical protein [Tannerella sp.]